MEKIEISIEQLDDMKHAIGYSRDKVKKGTYKAYRNYYADTENESWNELIKKGYAERYNGRDYINYSVSEKGIELLENILDIKITEIQ